jgi:hypothetical protein
MLFKDPTINESTPQSAGATPEQPAATAAQSLSAAASSTLESLPTIARTPGRQQIFLVADDVSAFLARDLDMSRLNRIHAYLWMAGRPLNARPLQRQRMMGMEIVVTEQLDLHLLHFSHRLLVKPLPGYLLSAGFWERYLCGSRVLHGAATGLLLSYVWLVCSPLDMKMALQLDLLPAGVTWPWWKAFVADVFAHLDVNALDQVNPRFQFGELRLGRVNSIYRVRFFFTHAIRGYLYGYNRYMVFFERNFAWVLGVFVYFSLVLSAMQVGSIVPPLNNNQAFQRATYGFVVLSIVLVVFFLGLIALLFVSTFLFNMVAAISHSRRKRLEREQLARHRNGKGE